MKRRTIIITILVLVAVAAALTVLNKNWWAKRINAKYQLQQPLTPGGTFVSSQSLRSLINLYYNGTMVDGTLAIAPRNP